MSIPGPSMWLIEKHGFTSPAAFQQNQLQPVAKAT